MKLRLATSAAFLFMVYGHSIAYSNPIDLTANFRLLGEVNRFSSLGFGDMFLSFGVNSNAISEIGRIEYHVASVPITTGVLSSLQLPSYGWQVVDLSFSIPFSLEIDQEDSMFIGLGTNHIGSAAGASGSKQVMFDFSDNISFVGSPLGKTLNQGLSLTSVTLADGTSLTEAGLAFEFIPEDTILSAFASAADGYYYGGTKFDIVLGTDGSAEVFNSKGVATSRLGGDSIPTEALVNLDVNPEPDPYVFDLAGASVGGTNNVRITRISTHPVPEPTSFALLSCGILVVLGHGLWCRFFSKVPGKTIGSFRACVRSGLGSQTR